MSKFWIFEPFSRDRRFFIGLEISEQPKNNFFSHSRVKGLAFTFQNNICISSLNRFLHAKVFFTGGGHNWYVVQSNQMALRTLVRFSSYRLPH